MRCGKQDTICICSSFFGEVIMTQHGFYDLVTGALEGRFDGIRRNYTPRDVERLRGSLFIAHTLAEQGANRLWTQLT